MYIKRIPRKKTAECKEEQLSKMKPDISVLRENFQHHRLCPYEETPNSKLTFLLAAIKYVKLQQRKKQKQDDHSNL
jgi:hypothetical protein